MKKRMKKSKEEVNYTEFGSLDRCCLECIKKSVHGCSVVKGKIEPRACCDEFDGGEKEYLRGIDALENM